MNTLQKNSKNSLLVNANHYQINEIKVHEERFLRENRRKSLKKKGLLEVAIKEEDYSPPRNLEETRNQDFSGLLKKISQEVSIDFSEEIHKEKLNKKDFSEKSCEKNISEEKSIIKEISEENKKETNEKSWETLKENDAEIMIGREICLEKKNNGLNLEKNEELMKKIVDNGENKEGGLNGLKEKLGIQTQESENIFLEDSLIMKEELKNEEIKTEDGEKINFPENLMNISKDFKINLLKIDNRKESFNMQRLEIQESVFIRIPEIIPKNQESSKIKSTFKISEIQKNAEEIPENIIEIPKIEENIKEIPKALKRATSFKILTFSNDPEIVKRKSSVHIPANKFPISKQDKFAEISIFPEKITEHLKMTTSQICSQTDPQSFKKPAKKSIFLQESLFPEKPYNIEGNSLRFFLNPFSEKYVSLSL